MVTSIASQRADQFRPIGVIRCGTRAQVPVDLVGGDLAVLHAPRLRRHPAAIEAGVNPAAVVDRINEAERERAAALTELDNLSEPDAASLADTHAMIDSLADVGEATHHRVAAPPPTTVYSCASVCALIAFPGVCSGQNLHHVDGADATWRYQHGGDGRAPTPVIAPRSPPWRPSHCWSLPGKHPPRYAHSLDADATPAQVWACYADPSRWPDFDRSLVMVDLDGPFST